MSGSKGPRVEWVDAGRGLAIVLVVVYHAARWLSDGGFDVSGWLTVNDTIASLRLPLFFVMAGLFAQRWVNGTWRALWSNKLSLFVWVYGVWSIIATFTFMLGLNLQGARGNYLYQLANLIWAPLLPRFELWFIWALTVFFVIARLIRRWPIWLQLSMTGLLSAVALSGVFVGNAGWLGSAKYFFFFLVGLLLRARLFSLAERATPPALTAFLVLWVAMAALGSLLGWFAVPGYYFLSCLAGLAAGLAVSKVLAHVGAARYLGARTLPVYLTHTSVIIIVVWLMWRTQLATLSAGWGWALVPAVALIAVVSSLGLSRALGNRPVARFLYEQPSWFSRAERRAAPGSV